MAEINDLTTVDASNTARWPENMAPSAVNDAGRAGEGLIARWHRDINGSVLTTGTSTAYVYAANQTIPAYYDGLLLGVDFHTACGASPTINVDALGAKSLKWPGGAAVGSGEIATGQKALLVYDGTDMIVLTAGGNAASKTTGADAGEIALNDQNWTAIASASTVNIGAAATNRVNITGTTTITAFDTVTAGLSREVRFDGALTLTHNGTSLILPGGANITTASGDVAKFVSEGSGNWRCLKYMKADGTAVIANASAVRVLDKDQSQLEIVNTVTETSIYSYSVPAGTLGTDSALRVTINGDYLNNSGASRAIGLKVKYGATTLYGDNTSTLSVDADRRAFSIDLLLAAKNSTSAQHLNGRVFVSPAGTAPTNGYGTAGDGLDVVFGGSSSEDSTATKTLDVTITHPAADANLSIRAEIRMIELVP